MPPRSPTPNWGYNETLERISSIGDAFTESFCAVGYITGARLNEIKQLIPSSLKTVMVDDRPMLMITTRTLKQAKTRDGVTVGTKWAFRTIPVNPLFEQYYYTHVINSLKNGNPFVKYSDRMIQYKLRTFLDIHPHDLRHLRATHLAKQRVPGQKRPPTIQELAYIMGWKKWEMAQVYIQAATPDEVARHL